MHNPNIIENLNPNQQKAVKHFNGPMMVLAGPGSGKTTVITYRIKHLIEVFNVSPCEILVITFTKASAEEMKNRFLKFSLKSHESVTFGTFHSFFFRIIRNYYNYTLENILNPFEKKEILKKIIQSEQILVEDEEELISNIELEISFLKNELINIENYNSTNIGSQEFKNIFNKYENYKKQSNKIDFDDMLVKCFECMSENKAKLSFWQNKYKFILIDEFQDINKVQYECIKLLSKPLNNLFIVGDDDQSIVRP